MLFKTKKKSFEVQSSAKDLQNNLVAAEPKEDHAMRLRFRYAVPSHKTSSCL